MGAECTVCNYVHSAPIVVAYTNVRFTMGAECTVCNYVLADNNALLSHLIEHERNILANFTTQERKVSTSCLALPPPPSRSQA